jgi:hypothetical protein
MGFPVSVASLPIPIQDVEVAGCEDAMIRLFADEHGQIGN